MHTSAKITVIPSAQSLWRTCLNTTQLLLESIAAYFSTVRNTTDRLWISTDMMTGWHIVSGTRIFSNGIITSLSRGRHGHRCHLCSLLQITPAHITSSRYSIRYV